MYSQELADKVCNGIIEGKGLRALCAEDGMPSVTTVMRWCRENTDFRQQYAHAREVQAELMLDEIIEIADDGTNDYMTITKGDVSYNVEDKEVTNRSKLRVDARKWAMAKLAPKKWGDSKAIDVTSGGQRVTGIAIVDYDDDSQA